MTGSAAGSRAQVALALLVVQASFAGFHVVAKLLLAGVDPTALVGLRVLFATPALVLLAWRHDRVLPRRHDAWRLGLLGLLGVFLNQLLFMQGLRLSTATNAAILVPSTPLFALAIAGVLGIERPGAKKALGIAVAVAGALVVIDPRRFVARAELPWGEILILGNCIVYAAFLVLQRPMLDRLPWRTVLAGSFVFGGAGVLAVAAVPIAELARHPLPRGLGAGLAYIVVLGTIVPYALNSWAIRRSSPSTAAAFTTLQPALTAALAVAFLGETLAPRQIVGSLLILAALGWVAATRHRPAPEASATTAG